MSDKKESSFVHEITDFYKQSKNFIINCQKPDKKGKNIISININLFNKNYRIYKNC